MRAWLATGLRMLGVAVVVGALCLLGAGLGRAVSRSGSLVRLGELVPSRTGEGLGPVVVSGDTVFAGAPDTTLDAQAQGAVLVFTKPRGGWAGGLRETAMLTAPGSKAGERLGSLLSASGETVAVGGAAGGVVDVFVEPARGWGGMLVPAARLKASDGAVLGRVVVSGQTIFAAGALDGHPGAVYVFKEPAGGWGGTVSESARLAASDGTPGDGLGAAVALSGSSVVAGAPNGRGGSEHTGAVYVFNEPAGGWAGRLREVAKLTGSDVTTTSSGPLPGAAPNFGSELAATQNTIVVVLAEGSGSESAGYVFSEPAAGWSSETESAKLTVSDGWMTAGLPAAVLQGEGGNPAVQDDLVVIPGALDVNLARPVEFVFARPASGWSGTQSESATLVPSDGGTLATPLITAGTILAGQLSGLSDQAVVGAGAYVFNEPAGGWSGRVNETGKLAGTGSPLPFGDDYVFTQPAGGWAAEGQAAMLSASGDPAEVTLGSVAAYGRTAVASGNGRAFVFSRPAGGWSGAKPVARLLDGEGGQLGPVAISAGAVAAATAQGIDVYHEPAGGWADDIQPAARLIPTNRGGFLNAVAVSGRTVFVGAAYGYNPITSEVDVFTEPAGGWSGVVHERAHLVLPGSGVSSLSARGNTVVVDGAIAGRNVISSGTGYVFTEPSGGWKGEVFAAARLRPPADTVYRQDYGVYAYEEPPGGWQGAVDPVAQLLPSGTPDAAPVAIAAAGDMVAVGVNGNGNGGRFSGCFPGEVWVYKMPPLGWQGKITAPRSAPIKDTPYPPPLDGTGCQGLRGLALAGDSLFAGGQPISPADPAETVGVFALTRRVHETTLAAGRPKLAGLHLSGLAAGHPALSFTVDPGANALGIASVQVKLPRGLSVADNAIEVYGGIVGDLGLLRADNVNRTLVITPWFGPGPGKWQVQIGGPTLLESRALRKKAQRIAHYNRTHRRERALRVQLTLTVVDVGARPARLQLADAAS